MAADHFGVLRAFEVLFQLHEHFLQRDDYTKTLVIYNGECFSGFRFFHAAEHSGQDTMRTVGSQDLVPCGVHLMCLSRNFTADLQRQNRIRLRLILPICCCGFFFLCCSLLGGSRLRLG